MTWEKMKPWEGTIHQGCLSCPPVLNIAPMDTLVGVGFGYAAILRDDKEVFREKGDMSDLHYLEEFEKMAAEDPDHSCLLILDAPLRGRTYQRQGDKQWVLVESNEGFL